MNIKHINLVILLLFFSFPAISYGVENYSPADFWREGDSVKFWQNEIVYSNQGYCHVNFVFDGRALNGGIENLTIFVTLKNPKGINTFTGNFVVHGNDNGPLGGSGVNAVVSAEFHGPQQWESMTDGEVSPLCNQESTMIVNKAIGKQNNKIVELISNNQLKYVEARKIKVKIK